MLEGKKPDLKIEVYNGLTFVWLKGTLMGKGVRKIVFTADSTAPYSEPKTKLELDIAVGSFDYNKPNYDLKETASDNSEAVGESNVLGF